MLLPVKQIWDGLPVFTQETIYHVCTEMRQSLGQRRTCIKNTHILLKNQHAATARLFLRKVSGIVVVYESGINLTC